MRGKLVKLLAVGGLGVLAVVGMRTSSVYQEVSVARVYDIKHLYV